MKATFDIITTIATMRFFNTISKVKYIEIRGTSILGEVRNVWISRATQQYHQKIMQFDWFLSVLEQNG